MESERIARIARDAFLNEPLFGGFTDIRKRPQIPLQAILMSLFAMPLLGLKSLLSNDREARTVKGHDIPHPGVTKIPHLVGQG